MKKVMDPETREIIMIDEKKEPNWMTKYRHNSGKAFAWAKPVKETPKPKAPAKPRAKRTTKK